MPKQRFSQKVKPNEEETASTKKLTVFGEKLYQQRAQAALPLLVRQARADTPITYSGLAEELGMPNPRNLDYVLGAIGSELKALSTSWDIEIPPLQFIVIQKNTGVPGDGVEMYQEVAGQYPNLSLKQKDRVVRDLLKGVYSFPLWAEVLEELGLHQPQAAVRADELQSAHQWRGTGEGEEHRRLKEFVAKNPRLFGLSYRGLETTVEYPLPSGDTVDILFSGPQLVLAVEVKGCRSSESDVLRGIYQCVKYKAVAEALEASRSRDRKVKSVLVLEGKLPIELIALRNTLGIDVFEGVHPR